MHSSALWFNYEACIKFHDFRMKINDWYVIWSVSSPMEVRMVFRYDVLNNIYYILCGILEATAFAEQIEICNEKEN